MRVQMATGKNLKKISKVISNGEVIDGTIQEHLEHKLGRTGSTNSIPEKTSPVKEDEKQEKIQVKQCGGCSSPAIDGKDYCPSCIIHIK